MFKSLVSVLALAASVVAEPGWWGDNDCQSCVPAPASCKNLPAQSTQVCWSSIQNARINVATCATPSSTKVVTVTSTANWKLWPTTTSKVTSTWLATQVVSVTVTSTTVLTEYGTATETAWASATATITSVDHTDVSTTKIISTISTSTTTINVDQTKETCQAKRAAGPIKKRGWNALPADCSCFLTSTTTSGIQTSTSTVTVTPTITVTSTIPAKATTTETQTVTKVATCTTEGWTATTITSTCTSTTTQVNTETWTITATQTSTWVATATATNKVDVCASFKPLGSKISSPNGWPNLGWASSFTDCCRTCYNTQNCVFFDFNPLLWTCTTYTNGANKDCVTNSCPKGKADVSLSPLNAWSKDQYGYGPCAGAGAAWS
ncbi:uncharacterized protein PV09_04070 [Verruconis gallopava]|uniref:Apple domain-containing protein n=1 Tax=Verruconis gallopava TaxID=253628 RepID=A0A0D2AD75_9PEZI|nr:uncharacterized protein PV09_04070 [Verruconis gallopava]KIW04898.1 hypothetical protein PV09_04070 [Verruconis gallopava]